MPIFTVNPATFRRIVRASATYDLAVTAPFATPWTFAPLAAPPSALHQQPGGAALPAVSPADPEAWARQADGQHPSIRLAQLALDVAQLETEKARAGHLPTVDAVASLGSSYNSRSGGG
eukprot:gene37186-42117_t